MYQMCGFEFWAGEPLPPSPLFWEYDTRLGRRWNQDPVFVPWESPYSTNHGNPILFSDPLGDFGSRKEAREYKKSHDIHGKIRSAKGGSFSIEDKKNGSTYYYGSRFGGNNSDDDKEPSNNSNDVTKSALAYGGASPGTFIKRTNLIGWGLDIIEGLFSSAHVPAWTTIPYRTVGSLDQTEVKAVVKTATFQKREKVTGSYTITFDNGLKYHGKGSIQRMSASAIEKMSIYHVKVTMLDWTPSMTNRQAFKDEYKRMQTDATPQYPEG